MSTPQTVVTQLVYQYQYLFLLHHFIFVVINIRQMMSDKNGCKERDEIINSDLFSLAACVDLNLNSKYFSEWSTETFPISIYISLFNIHNVEIQAKTVIIKQEEMLAFQSMFILSSQFSLLDFKYIVGFQDVKYHKVQTRHRYEKTSIKLDLKIVRNS